MITPPPGDGWTFGVHRGTKTQQNKCTIGSKSCHEKMSSIDVLLKLKILITITVNLSESSWLRFQPIKWQMYI